MQSNLIEVKFMPPTNSKDRRIRIKTWDLSHYNNDKACVKYVSWPSLSEINDCADEFLSVVGKNLNLEARNDRGPDTVLMFKWDIQEMAKIFGYEKEVSNDI